VTAITKAGGTQVRLFLQQGVLDSENNPGENGGDDVMQVWTTRRSVVFFAHDHISSSSSSR